MAISDEKSSPQEIAQKAWDKSGRKTVSLVGLGAVPAIPARLVKPGMMRFYNYSFYGTITSVVVEPKWVYLEIVANGKSYTRKHKPDTLIPIGISSPG